MKPREDSEPPFDRADAPLQLATASAEIAADVQRCQSSLPSAISFPELTAVVVGGEEVSLVNGWTRVSELGPFDRLELCGAACDDFEAVGQATVSHFCQT